MRQFERYVTSSSGGRLEVVLSVLVGEKPNVEQDAPVVPHPRAYLKSRRAVRIIHESVSGFFSHDTEPQALGFATLADFVDSSLQQVFEACGRLLQDSWISEELKEAGVASPISADRLVAILDSPMDRPFPFPRIVFAQFVAETAVCLLKDVLKPPCDAAAVTSTEFRILLKRWLIFSMSLMQADLMNREDIDSQTSFFPNIYYSHTNAFSNDDFQKRSR